MRFPPIAPEHWTAEQKDVAAQIVSGPRGELRGPFVPLLYAPQAAAIIQKLGEHLRFHTGLSNALLEIAILVTARHFNCPNIWQSHRLLALKAGLNPAIIAAIARDERPTAMSAEETAIYDFSRELALTTRVGDAAFDAVVHLWSKATAIELTATCGYYVTLAMVLNMARVPLPGNEPAFQP